MNRQLPFTEEETEASRKEQLILSGEIKEGQETKNTVSSFDKKHTVF